MLFHRFGMVRVQRRCKEGMILWVERGMAPPLSD
jgi:hypothetical protein